MKLQEFFVLFVLKKQILGLLPHLSFKAELLTNGIYDICSLVLTSIQT